MGAGLSDPLKRSLEVLERAKSGSLNARVVLNFDRQDEMGMLTQGINALLDSIENVYNEDNVEISKDLSEVSSHQAAASEEISSSLEEIFEVTKDNSNSARSVNTLMQSTSKKIKQASASMQELSNSIDEISKASSETQKIIKTIDEVAFQTNLLALNAAVEAARAGEAGAGFAVVADEVRNLAMRAAEAARDTADMIQGTVSKVEHGAKVTANAQQFFDEVVQDIEQTELLISKINNASDSQVESLSQIKEGVMELANLTQRNAQSAQTLIQSIDFGSTV